MLKDSKLLEQQNGKESYLPEDLKYFWAGILFERLETFNCNVDHDVKYAPIIFHASSF